MRRTHRLSARLIRWTSLSVCFALVLSCFVVTPLAKPNHNSTVLAQGQSGSQNGKGKKVEPAPPVTGPPGANLPNLDEVRQRRQDAPAPPPQIPSTMRSPRKLRESRRGVRTSDPLAPARRLSYGTRNTKREVMLVRARIAAQAGVRLRCLILRARSTNSIPLSSGRSLSTMSTS